LKNKDDYATKEAQALKASLCRLVQLLLLFAPPPLLPPPPSPCIPCRPAISTPNFSACESVMAAQPYANVFEARPSLEPCAFVSAGLSLTVCSRALTLAVILQAVILKHILNQCAHLRSTVFLPSSTLPSPLWWGLACD
jgi:hypothetical protein